MRSPAEAYAQRRQEKGARLIDEERACLVRLLIRVYERGYEAGLQAGLSARKGEGEE